MLDWPGEDALFGGKVKTVPMGSIGGRAKEVTTCCHCSGLGQALQLQFGSISRILEDF